VRRLSLLEWKGSPYGVKESLSLGKGVL
jgi:hypothetical protein